MLTDLSKRSESTPQPSLPTPELTVALPDLKPVFSLSPAPVEGYSSTLPSANVDFSFPAEDQKRVEAWFSGDFSHVTSPESATLKKNMATAVLSALRRYTSAAISQNLLFSPFRIGWRYRLFDGSAAAPENTEMLIPLGQSLQLIVNSYNIYEKALHTQVVFSHSPSRILLKINPPFAAEGYLDIITAVEFYINTQRDLFAPDANVNGLRSVTSEGVRQRIWSYEAYDPANLSATAKADTDFRIIASIPFQDIASGKYSAETLLPIEAGAMQRFSTLQKAVAEDGSADSTPSSGGVTAIDGWKPFIHAETHPLDLSHPETSKSIKSLYLTGVFQRRQTRISLLASHDREHWMRLASSDNHAINGICRTPFRWFKIEFQLPMRKNDFLDSLVIDFKKSL